VNEIRPHDGPNWWDIEIAAKKFGVEFHELNWRERNWGKTPGTQLQQNKGQSGSVTLPP